ncbi:MAG TPA: hypothetical protein VGF84_19965 [Micromonosporaceae bacterium]
MTPVSPRVQLLFATGLLAYPGMVVAAIFGAVWPFALLGLLSLATEAVLQTRAPGVNWNLTRGGVGWTVRSTIRSLSVIVFAAVAYGHRTFLAVALGMAVIEGCRACYSLAMTYTKIRRTVPAATRNVDLAALRIPSLRYGFLTRVSPRSTMALGVLPLLGVLGGADTAAITTGIAAVLALAAAGIVGIAALRAIRLPSDQALLAEVHRQILDYSPDVVVYFSGTVESLYQINMWLDVVTALPYRVLIVMRERANVGLLAPTSLPVVCLPSAVDLMNFEMPSVTLALYPANTGKNIHFLRVPGMMHVFVGHGDSDKIASVNPFSKAYDEIWVAGPGGRERWARAAVGVLDEDVVEVGRPQLAAIRHAADHRRSGVFTVLYAPTWEGWTPDAQNTSLLTMGTSIVSALLAMPGVRVIYKPHPFTGTRDPQARAAGEAIATMIAMASPPEPGSAGLAELEERITAIGHANPLMDDLDAARESGGAHPDYAAQVARLRAEWNAAFWASRPTAAHRCITEPLAELFDCFNQADLLITDISSVVADFLYSEKPYVVTNSSDLPEAEFRDRYPTASAAYLLGSDCAGLATIVTDLSAGLDPRAEDRAVLKRHLLGPEEVLAGDRFGRAVQRAVSRALALPTRSDVRPEEDQEPEPVAPVTVD